MMQPSKVASAALFLVLLSCLVAAASQNFNMQWHPEIPGGIGGFPEDPPVTYLNSNLDASPQVSATSVICVGNPATVTFTSTSSWNNGGTFDAGTANSATDRSQLSTSYSQPSGPYSLQWLTGTQSNNLYTQNYFATRRYFQREPSTNQWTAFLTNNNIPTGYPQYQIGAYYKCPNGIPNYFSQTSGGSSCNPAPSPPYTKYRAYTALFCNAKAVIAIQNGPTYNTDDYMGQSIVKTVNGLSLGQHTVSSSLAVQRCMVPILDDGTFSVKSTAVMIDNAFAPTYTGTQSVIDVQNPFSCSSVTASAVPPTAISATQGVPFNVQFTVNNANSYTSPLSVNTNSITVSSGFTKNSVTPGGTVSIPSPGSQTFTASITAASQGSQTLTITIPSYASQLDCNSQSHNCQNTVQFTVNVGVGDKPNLIISNLVAPDAVFVLRTFFSTATTKNIGAAPAGASVTSVTFPVSQQQNINVPVLAVNAEYPGTVALQCQNVGSNSLVANADSTFIIDESNEGDNGASRTVICYNKPNSCTLAFVNHGTDFTPGDSAQTRATCFFNGVPTLCPNFTWSQTANGGSMSPTFTTEALNPISTLAISPSAPTPQFGQSANATSAEPDMPIRCGVDFNVLPPGGLKPDYIPLISTGTAYVGEQFTSAITTRNQGTRLCENQSQTNYEFNGGNYGFFIVQPLGIGSQQADTRNFTCPSSQGSYPLAANVDSTFRCDESNENNNYLQIQVNCVPRPVLPPISCSLAPNPGGTYTLGGTGTFTATCRDQNNAPTYCSQLGWTSTRGTMEPTSTANGTTSPQSLFTAASLGLGEVRATASNFFCLSPVNVTSGFQNLVLTCSLVDHGPDFFPGESATVRADCDNGSPQCPDLAWSTTINPATMTPPLTQAGPSPQFSLFSISPSAVPPQVGVVHVQCANAQECTAQCDVNVNLFPLPNRLVCNLENRTQVPPNLFSANDWSWVRGRCYINSLETICPNLTWFTRNDPIPNTFFVPNPTLQQIGPLTNFSTRNVPPPFPRHGFIDANSANPIVSLACEAAVNITVVQTVGPNYQIVKLTPSKILALQGELVKITIWTRNVGNVLANAASLTVTNVLPGDCLPDSYSVAALMPGQTDTHDRYDYSCPCTTIGLHRIVAEANADRSVIETNYDDNNRTAIFYCGSNYTLICPDYV